MKLVLLLAEDPNHKRNGKAVKKQLGRAQKTFSALSTRKQITHDIDNGCWQLCSLVFER